MSLSLILSGAKIPNLLELSTHGQQEIDSEQKNITSRLSDQAPADEADEVDHSDEWNTEGGHVDSVIANIVKRYEESASALKHQTKDEIFNGLMEAYTSMIETINVQLPSKLFFQQKFTAIAIEKSNQISKKTDENQNKSNTQPMKRSRRALENIQSKKWPNNIVPFKFDGSHTAAQQAIIKEAMDRIASVSSIRFIEATSKHAGYILFSGAGGGVNESLVGKHEETIGYGNITLTTEKLQRVALDFDPKENDKTHLRTAAHEILHVLGFFHEHSRADRSAHLNPEINHQTDHNYMIRPGLIHGSYDHQSAMQYAFIGLLGPEDNPIIQIFNDAKGDSPLSLLDILALNRRYPAIGEIDPVLAFTLSWLETMDELDRNDIYKKITEDHNSKLANIQFIKNLNDRISKATTIDALNAIRNEYAQLDLENKNADNLEIRVAGFLSRFGITDAQRAEITQIKTQIDRNEKELHSLKNSHIDALIKKESDILEKDISLLTDEVGVFFSQATQVLAMINIESDENHKKYELKIKLDLASLMDFKSKLEQYGVRFQSKNRNAVSSQYHHLARILARLENFLSIQNNILQAIQSLLIDAKSLKQIYTNAHAKGTMAFMTSETRDEVFRLEENINQQYALIQTESNGFSWVHPIKIDATIKSAFIKNIHSTQSLLRSQCRHLEAKYQSQRRNFICSDEPHKKFILQHKNAGNTINNILTNKMNNQTPGNQSNLLKNCQTWLTQYKIGLNSTKESLKNKLLQPLPKHNLANIYWILTEIERQEARYTLLEIKVNEMQQAIHSTHTGGGIAHGILAPIFAMLHATLQKAARDTTPEQGTTIANLPERHPSASEPEAPIRVVLATPEQLAAKPVVHMFNGRPIYVRNAQKRDTNLQKDTKLPTSSDGVHQAVSPPEEQHPEKSLMHPQQAIPSTNTGGGIAHSVVAPLFAMLNAILKKASVTDASQKPNTNLEKETKGIPSPQDTPPPANTSASSNQGGVAHSIVAPLFAMINAALKRAPVTKAAQKSNTNISS